MKVRLKQSLAVFISLAGLTALAGCGGSSSQDPVGDVYTGAASVGDMAEFTVNGSSLSYNLSGAHFGNTSGGLTIQPINGTTAFYESQAGSQTIGLMLTGNFGVAIVPDVPDLLNPPNTVNAFVTGLKNATNNEADVSGKSFVYITYQTGAEAYVLKLYNDNHFVVQRVMDYLADLTTAGNAGLNGEPGTTNAIQGCWRASGNGNYLNAVTDSDPAIASAVVANTCGSFDFVAAGYDTAPASTSSNYYRFMIKPGLSRVGLVVDMADGSGFGVGLETVLESTTPVSAPPASDETYSAFAAPNITTIDLSTLFNVSTGASPFHEVVVKPNLLVETTPMTCNYGSSPISCSTPSVNPVVMDTDYDKFCYPDPNNIGAFVAVDMPGMTCVFEQSLVNPGRIYNALIDDQDGFFFAASLLGPEFIIAGR